MAEDPTQIVDIFTAMLIIVAIMFVVFTVFGMITFAKFLKRKSKVAGYLTLNFLIYAVAVLIMLFSYNSVIVAGEKTLLYYRSSGYFLAFAALGTIFLYLFFMEISKIDKKKSTLVIICGVLLLIWTLLPFNDWDTTLPEGFHIRFITYLFTLIYYVVVYIGMAVTFLKMYKIVPENKNSILSIGLGCVVFSLYFLLITLYGILQVSWLMMVGMLIILVSEGFFFVGFILPSLKK